jgi:hypothetical protein
VGRLHLRGALHLHSLVPTYASAAYGCALAHSPQTSQEVRATFYSRLSQTGPPVLHARFPSRSPVDYSFPTLGFDPAGDSIYDKSPDR